MTQSPPPRWDLLDMESYLSLPVQFCRGCPFHCEFCDVTVMMGKAVRAKTPQQILDELQKLYDLGWRGEVAFVDDNIIGNIKRIKELCRVIIPWMRKHGYPFEFQTQTSLNLAFKQESARPVGRSRLHKNLRRHRGALAGDAQGDQEVPEHAG